MSDGSEESVACAEVYAAIALEYAEERIERALVVSGPLLGCCRAAIGRHVPAPQ